MFGRDQEGNSGYRVGVISILVSCLIQLISPRGFRPVLLLVEFASCWLPTGQIRYLSSLARQWVKEQGIFYTRIVNRGLTMIHVLGRFCTWFGDDVIRFVPAAGWPNRCATSMQFTMTSLPENSTQDRIMTAFYERNKGVPPHRLYIFR